MFVFDLPELCSRAEFLQKVNKAYLTLVYAHCNYSATDTAKFLKISRASFYVHAKNYGLELRPKQKDDGPMTW